MLSPLHKTVGETSSLQRRKRASFLNTPEGKSRYQARGCSIEPFFATIKAIFHFDRAPVRGLNKVSAFFLGVLYSWNLVVLFNYLHDRPLGAVKSFLEAL